MSKYFMMLDRDGTLVLDEQRWFRIYDEWGHPSTKTPAIFLDRDGIIVVEKQYDIVNNSAGVPGNK